MTKVLSKSIKKTLDDINTVKIVDSHKYSVSEHGKMWFSKFNTRISFRIDSEYVIDGRRRYGTYDHLVHEVKTIARDIYTTDGCRFRDDYISISLFVIQGDDKLELLLETVKTWADNYAKKNRGYKPITINDISHTMVEDQHQSVVIRKDTLPHGGYRYKMYLSTDRAMDRADDLVRLIKTDGYLTSDYTMDRLSSSSGYFFYNSQPFVWAKTKKDMFAMSLAMGDVIKKVEEYRLENEDNIS